MSQQTGAYSAVQRIINVSQEWRGVTLVLSAGVFTTGMVVSGASLAGQIDKLAILPLLLVFLVLAPVSLALHAAQLVICARMGERELTFGEAFLNTALSRILNILPLPAGFGVRWAALVNVGLSGSASATFLVLSSVVWLGLALGLSGLVLVNVHNLTALPFMLGSTVLFGCLAWFTLNGLLVLGLVLILNRCLLLLTFSIQLCFILLSMGTEATLLETAYYSLASVIGTVVPFFPSGLGISEAAGAILARAIGESAAIVFLAIGINRITGLLFCGLVSLVGARRLYTKAHHQKTTIHD